MLSELCHEIKNYFDRNQPHLYGTLTIENGAITDLEFIEKIQMGQYYRIVGSVFNDGVHKYGDNTDTLKDEEFDGAIWLMAVPKEVIDLSAEIDQWIAKNKDVIDSPYSSESFGGYSYNKGSGEGAGTWQKQFAYKLANWRKI